MKEMKDKPSIINGSLIIGTAILYLSNRLFLDGSPVVFVSIMVCLIGILTLLIFRATDNLTRTFGSLLVLSIVLSLLYAYKIPLAETFVFFDLATDCLLIIIFVREQMHSRLSPGKFISIFTGMLIPARWVTILFFSPDQGVTLNILVAAGLFARIFIWPFANTIFSHTLTVYLILILISLLKTIL